jgi:hypothetical protein
VLRGWDLDLDLFAQEMRGAEGKKKSRKRGKSERW